MSRTSPQAREPKAIMLSLAKAGLNQPKAVTNLAAHLLLIGENDGLKAQAFHGVKLENGEYSELVRAKGGVSDPVGTLGSRHTPQSQHRALEAAIRGYLNAATDLTDTYITIEVENTPRNGLNLQTAYDLTHRRLDTVNAYEPDAVQAQLIRDNLTFATCCAAIRNMRRHTDTLLGIAAANPTAEPNGKCASIGCKAPTKTAVSNLCGNHTRWYSRANEGERINPDTGEQLPAPRSVA